MMNVFGPASLLDLVKGLRSASDSNAYGESAFHNRGYIDP